MGREEDAAKCELLRQAEAHVKLLEADPKGVVCASHGDLAKGVAMSLRMQMALYSQGATVETQIPVVLKPFSQLGAALGLPGWVVAAVVLWGTAQGWW
jgi:hypothetical protein